MAEVKNLSKVNISELVPYENNAKIHGKKQITNLQKSIERFGFLSPILIDKDKNIIAGHGRVEAAKGLGVTELPCVYIEGLTEDEKRAYIIADNRFAELDTKWDMKLVAAELADIKNLDFDISAFEMPDIEEIERRTYGQERRRTGRTYNMDILDRDDLTEDFWQMPTIRNNGIIPDDLIGFNYAKSSDNKKVGIHFYLDDYQFERIWTYPEKYLGVLWEYDCILSPDFSLYLDMPMPLKIWNTYRSRQIGAYYQAKGMNVILTVSWAEPATFEFCFKGIPEGSIVSVSTIGVKTDNNALDIWYQGMDEMIKQIKPSTILVYGGQLDYDYKDIDVRYYDNKVVDNWGG